MGEAERTAAHPGKIPSKSHSANQGGKEKGKGPNQGFLGFLLGETWTETGFLGVSSGKT